MFRGWATYGGQEFANTSRVVDHLRPTLPTRDAMSDIADLAEGPRHLYAPTDIFVQGRPHTYDRPVMLLTDDLPHTYRPQVYEASLAPQDGGAQCACDTLTLGYDDSWTELRTWLGEGGGCYLPQEAPWYNPSVPASAEFVGVWVMSVEGLDALPVSRDINDAVCGGGVAGPVRTPARELDFDVLVIGCTNAGARYGLSWLSRTLRTAQRSGVDMEFLDAHPQDTSESPDALARRMHRVVLTSAPTVSETSGHGGGNQHRQASVLRADFTLTALDPYVWGLPRTHVPDFTVETVGTEWGHDPDCDRPESCPSIPTLLSDECRITPLDMQVPPIPVCGGCSPLCEIERHVWQLPSALSDEVGVTVTVHNPTDEALSLTGFLRECGQEDVCDERYPIAVRGLPAGQTVVADAPRGRAYGLVDGEQVRQVGIVSTPSGAPWTPPVIDGIMCWELVLDTAPGTPVDVTVTVQERQP